MIFGFNACTSWFKHCAFFGFDDGLLFCGRSCSLHSSVKFNDFGIASRGGRRIRCKNFLFGFDDSLFFFRAGCCEKGSVECHNFGLNLSFSLLGRHSSKALVLLATNDDGRRIVLNRSGVCESLLFKRDLSLLFTFKLSIDLSLCKSRLQILFFFGSLSSIQSHLESHNFGLNFCHLCGTLVGLLLQLCSFLFSLLLVLEFELHLSAANSGFGKRLTFILIQNLFCLGNRIISEHRSHRGVGIEKELVFIFLSELGLNVDIYIRRGLLSAVHQHVLNTADDVGRVINQVCNYLYRSKLFRRHGDHIHLTLGGDGQKANGNDTNTCSTNTAKVFLSTFNRIF